MFRTAFGAATLLIAIPAAAPANAQSQQERLDARYDRALAAGYKALMLCSAIAIAERNGTTRTPESVAQWELSGIQPPLDAIVGDLPFSIVRRPSGQIAHVAVTWADDMPARVAAYYGPDTGCSALPISAPEDSSDPAKAIELPPREAPKVLGTMTLKGKADPNWKPKLAPVDSVFEAALSGAYGEATRTTVVMVNHPADRKGKVSSARFAPGFDDKTPQRTWSVAKSIAATLVGAAVQAGDASVDDPVALNYWQAAGVLDVRNAITIDHALRMATGRFSDTPGNRTDPLYWGGSTVDETTTGWPVLHQPGSVFRYANNDTLIAVKAIGRWLDYYPPSEFFAKVGMTQTVAETDWKGSYILSSQVWTTANDLAKFG